MFLLAKVYFTSGNGNNRSLEMFIHYESFIEQCRTIAIKSLLFKCLHGSVFKLLIIMKIDFNGITRCIILSSLQSIAYPFKGNYLYIQQFSSYVYYQSITPIGNANIPYH